MSEVSLLGAFELRCDGELVPLAMSAQRLLAFLAVHDRALLRPHVAGSLWLDSLEERAHASLRSALWRLNKPGFGLVKSTSSSLELAARVRVDFRESTDLAHRLVRGSECDIEGAAASLAGDLLPDWYDDWVLLEREHYRQLRLHALEALCERLTAAGVFGAALEAALTAVAGEPLRESANRMLVRLHLAEGNPSEALREYHVFRAMLRDRLGLEPSAQMEELVRGLAH